LADTSDSDVIKIIKIDVSTSKVSNFDTDLQFNGALIDGDGDSANFNFAVHLEADSTTLTGTAVSDYLTGTSLGETIDGGAGDDTLIGSAGNDTLIGGTGADVFKWQLGDSGSDVVKDFNLDEGDKLSLQDLLPDTVSVENLSSYLDISEVVNSESGTTTVTVKFDSTGLSSFTTPTQTITLENTALTFDSTDDLMAKLTKLQGGDPSL
jgi:Ca2+-binding RTX toxin-like protein